MPIFVLAALCTSPTAMSAQDEKVSLNFVNADIEEVIRAVSHITGRNFVVDPRVKGTINIISSTPVAAPLAYDILLSTLRMQGFAAVEAGGVTKILPEADAKLYVSGVNDRKGSGEKLVTRVYVLKYESAAQMVPVLRPLIAPNNIVVAYPNNNTLVVTDYASNLRRIEQIVNAIDQPGKGAPVIIPVKRASAIELAQTINRLLQDGAVVATGSTDASQRFVLLADARTNSLLLRTENQERLDRVRDLVEKLDIETSTLGNMHVVYLKNAEAVKLAQTLRAVLSGDTSATVSAGAAGTPGSPAASSAAAGPTGGGMIQADAATNALIITAPSNVYNNMRAVIDMLDVRRAQVFVEALVAEVSADKAADFGVQWMGASAANSAGDQVGGGTNFGGAGTNIIGIATNPLSVGPGLSVGVVKGGNLGVLARAMQSDTDTNILSTPNLMMLDNEEAKIIIGENVPFITGSQNGTAANPNPFQTIERKDVGLILKIKPQISEGGTVKMLIFQEVSSVKETTVTTATTSAGPTTVKRSIDTTVLVDDGQILVLGGLIQDRVEKSEFKVPLLGDIPLLGWLFRYETRKSGKVNLMVFIRPSILRTALASQGLTNDRYEYLRNQQELTQMPWNLILPSMPAPVSPELAPAPVPSAPLASAAAQTTPAPASRTEQFENAKEGESVKENTTAAATPPAVTAPVAEPAPAAVIP